jgi:radical SAM superfamily enzyme YgiQ (UPF0313 family)
VDQAIKNADFVLMSALSPGINNVFGIANRIKEIEPGIIILLGGIFPSLNAEYCASQCAALDVIVMGEGEEITPRIIAAYEAGHPEKLRQENGILFRMPGGNDLEFRPGHNVVADLDSLPDPAYQLLGVESEPRVLRVFAERGCSAACSFCAPSFVARHRVRARSADLVVRSIIRLKKEFKASSFVMGDLTFLDTVSYGQALLNQLIEAKLDLPFWCQTRLDRITEENVKLLAQAGCRWVAVGLESFDNSVLHNANKEICVDDMVQKLMLLKRYGMETQAYFIVGLPSETPKSIEKTIRFIEHAINRGFLDLTHISLYVPYPGLPVDKNVTLVDFNLNHYHQGVFLDMPPTPVFRTQYLDPPTILSLFLKTLENTAKAFRNRPQISFKQAVPPTPSWTRSLSTVDHHPP